MKRFLLILCCMGCALTALCDTPDTIEIAALLQEQLYPQLIDHTTRLIEQEPKSGVLHYYRALGYVHTDQLRRALADADQAIAYPEDCNLELDELYVWRGHIYLLQGQKDEAISDFTSAIKKRPNEPRHYITRAQCFASRMQYSRAAQDYYHASQLAPDQGEYRLEYARMLILSGQYQSGHDELTDLKRLNPHDTEAVRLLALTDYHYGHYAEAVHHYIEYTNRNMHEYGRVDDTELLESAAMRDYAATYHILSDEINRLAEEEDYALRNVYLMARATNYIQRGYWQDALWDLGEISVTPLGDETNTTLLQRRAYCYQRLHQWDQAIAHYNRLIRLQSEDNSHYAMRGICYRQTGQLAEAQKDFLYILHRDTAATYRIARLLGEVYLQQQMADKAIEALTQSISHNPVSDPVATCLRGQAYLLAGDTLMAHEEFEQVLETDTTLYHSVRHIALYYLEREDEAQEWLDLIIEAYPYAEQTYTTAAELMHLMGRYDEEQYYYSLAQQVR